MDGSSPLGPDGASHGVSSHGISSDGLDAAALRPRALNPRCVREYDIRGVVDQTLSVGDVRLIGRAYGTIVAASGGRMVCVGYDGRISSPAFEEAVVDGLAACGLHVVRIGLGPSPMLYHAVHAFVVSDVKASEALFDEVRRLGGTPVMWRTGHSPIKAKMRETGAALAGDVSGHVFFADRYYGFDDGLYGAVRLLDVLARTGQPLADLVDELPNTVITPELRFPCADIDKFGVVEQIRRRLAEIGADMTDIDGVRVRTPDGWWLLRASNTEDALTARAEASDQSGFDRLKRQIADYIEACGLKAPVF